MNCSVFRFAFAPALSLIVVMASDVMSQERDPFTSDPFASRNRSRQVSPDIDITFQVMDQEGNPVPDAQIRGYGLARPLFTNLDGEATWPVTENLLKRGASRFRGSLRFNVVAPKGAVMPHVSKAIPIAELLEKKSVRFEMRPGVRLKGRVVGAKKLTPIKGVAVEALLEEDPTGKSRWLSSTDEHGEWSVIVPLADTVVHVVARGLAKGYDLQDLGWQSSKYSRSFELPSGSRDAESLDFEIDPMPTLQIEVRDRDGRPVTGAFVSLYREHWFNSKMATLDQVSGTERTGPDGQCALLVKESDGPEFVTAVVDAGGVKLEGRTDLDFKMIRASETVQVVVRPHTKISGVLQSGGKPAQNVPLVLYEAIDVGSGRWTTIGLRGEIVTDRLGRYEFAACGGLHYMVTTKTRDKNDRQTVLHRTKQAITQKAYEVPVVDLDAIR